MSSAVSCFSSSDPPTRAIRASPPVGSRTIKILLGVLLLALAAKQWRGRPADGVEPELPKWMAAIDSFTPVKSAGIAALLSGVNPKNLLLVVSAATTIAATEISGAEQAVAFGVFCLIGTIGVAIPVIVYFFLGDRAPALLGHMQTWMAKENSVIMAVIILVIGAKMLGDGLSAL